MRDIKEPLNMYDPHSEYPSCYSFYSYSEQLQECFEEVDSEEFIDLEDLYNIYNS